METRLPTTEQLGAITSALVNAGFAGVRVEGRGNPAGVGMGVLPKGGPPLVVAILSGRSTGATWTGDVNAVVRDLLVRMKDW